MNHKREDADAGRGGSVPGRPVPATGRTAGRSAAADLLLLGALTAGLRAAGLLAAPTLLPTWTDLGLTWGDGFVPIARDILAKGLGPDLGLPIKPIGLPLVFAFLLKISGGSLLWLRVFQILCASLSTGVIYVLGIKLFGRRTALLAGAVSACYPLFIKQDITFYAESLFMLLYLVSCTFLISFLIQPRNRNLLLGGLFLGLAAAVKPAPLSLIPFLGLFFFWLFRRDLRRLAWIFLGTVVIPLAVLTPWGLRNAALGYGFRLTDSMAGLSFYQGNSPFGEKYYFEHIHLQNVHGLRWREELGLTAPADDSAYHYRKGFEYIRENPRTAWKLLAAKIAHFWKLWPYEARDPVTILSYALIPPLGFLGMVLGFRARPRIVLFLLGTFLTFTLSFGIVWVEVRYRIPIVDPFLILFAASLAFPKERGPGPTP